MKKIKRWWYRMLIDAINIKFEAGEISAYEWNKNSRAIHIKLNNT